EASAVALAKPRQRTTRNRLVTPRINNTVASLSSNWPPQYYDQNDEDAPCARLSHGSAPSRRPLIASGGGLDVDLFDLIVLLVGHRLVTRFNDYSRIWLDPNKVIPHRLNTRDIFSSYLYRFALAFIDDRTPQFNYAVAHYDIGHGGRRPVGFLYLCKQRLTNRRVIFSGRLRDSRHAH